MTKFERIQRIRTYFKEVGRIEGAVPCILWKHLWEPNIYLYSREDESLSVNEVIVVKSPTSKVDKVLKYSIKHYFQTEDELDAILRTLSDKNMTKPQDIHPPEPRKEEETSFVPKPKLPESKNFNPLTSSPANFNFESYQPSTSTPTSFSPQNSFSPTPSMAPPKKEVKLDGKVVGLVAFILLLVAAFITNPELGAHRKAVQDKLVNELVQAPSAELVSLTETKETAQVENSQLSGVDLIKNSVPTMVHRKNFLFFSLTELQLGGQQKIIGAGVFSNVWLLEPESGSYQAYLQEPSDNGASQMNSEERLALESEMKRAIIVAVMEKFMENPDDEQLTYKFVLHNRSNRNIKSFHGLVRFFDDANNEIKAVPLEYDRPLGIGERAIFHVTSDYDSNSEADTQLKNITLDKLTMDWEPSEILFNDGTNLSLVSLE
uniref:Uncharacterized protein n=1 Tax=Roseihalotalea indica TaxID=2867963 RepID=A0AA49GSD9_9BACT|nr:hypothetical protein K4G66_29155 [Tunicatimonas sp. TK19036]